MEDSQNLTEVVKALQSIIKSPELPLSHDHSSLSQHGISLPVLPAHIPKLPIPSIDRPLVSQTANDEHGRYGDGLSELSSYLTTTVLPYLNLASISPNYYGFVIGGATPAALLGDFLASIYDQNVHVHLPKDTISTTVEVAALNMLVQLFRLPEADWSIGKHSSPGGGVFTTGATASNVLGLALGREFVIRKALERQGIPKEDASCGEFGVTELMLKAKAKKLQILSTMPHSSVAKAASIVGIGRRNVISIASESDPLEVDMDKLRQEASKADVVNILAISTGEVNTGRFATNSIDQWHSIRQLCDEAGIWIHVDGAFGLFGRLFSPDEPKHRDYEQVIRGVQGIELADSITGDCHKLLNVPYDCGVFFTRHKQLSEEVFGNGNAAYLTSALSPDVSDDIYNAIQSPLNLGLENSRRFRALPVYATLLAHGRQGYIDMLERQIGLARQVTVWMLNDTRFEVLPGSMTGNSDIETVAKTFIIVLFRIRNDVVMRDFVSRVNGTGKMFISGTVWDGKPAARIAVSNWQVDIERDSRLIVQVLDEIAW